MLAWSSRLNGLARTAGGSVLGEFRVTGVELDWLRSRKSRTLLKRLALEEGRVLSVDALIDAVWRTASRGT
jgi:DNA-binding SARP family transcriptional activator